MLRFEEVGEDVIEAARVACGEIAVEAAEAAKGTSMNIKPHFGPYPWYGLTARTEDAVTSAEGKVEGGIIFAEFGATVRRGDYAFLLEREHPYLQPVADEAFPRLASRIREILEQD